MGKVTKTQVEKKMDDLKIIMEKYLVSMDVDQNLVKANSDLLRKKEDLEESLEIQGNKEKTLRRELSKANTELKDLRERNKSLEAELKAYRSSVKMIEELKSNLERGLIKLAPDNAKYIAE